MRFKILEIKETDIQIFSLKIFTGPITWLNIHFKFLKKNIL